MGCKIVYYDKNAAIKANDLAVEGLKQLLTIAGALLALTITFIKDFLGAEASRAQWFFLVPLAWLFLALSIWWGWVSIADGARCLGTGESSGYVYGSGTPRLLARMAQWAFFAGLLCLISFATMNFHRPTSSESGRDRSGKIINQ
jgi:hypothetical protein